MINYNQLYWVIFAVNFIQFVFSVFDKQNKSLLDEVIDTKFEALATFTLVVILNALLSWVELFVAKFIINY